MSSLTIRNLTSTHLRFIRVAQFNAPEPDGGGIANITSNFTTLLSKTPLKKLPIKLPTSPAPLPADAPSTSSAPLDFSLHPHSSTVSNSLALAIGTISRIDLEIPESGHTFTISITRAGSPPTVTRHSGDTHDLWAVYHSSHHHLCITSSASLSTWLSRLPSDTLLSSLSIPGTHNSAAYHQALPSVRCQSVSVTAQLENGVRFLDLRVQPTDLALVHGAFPVALRGGPHLPELLEEVYTFLSKNPSEFVLVSLKREGRSAGLDDTDFSRRVSELIAKNTTKWYTASALPKLGDVRGKCVLFRRFVRHVDHEFGLDAESWEYNCTHHVRGAICVQDLCEAMDSADVKLEAVRDHLERARNNKDALHVNFLSASNFWKVKHWPEKVAKRVEPEVREHLAVRHEKGGTGVVIADFVGEDGDWRLCRLVVGMNGMLETKGGQ